MIKLCWVEQALNGFFSSKRRSLLANALALLRPCWAQSHHAKPVHGRSRTKAKQSPKASYNEVCRKYININGGQMMGSLTHVQTSWIHCLNAPSVWLKSWLQAIPLRAIFKNKDLEDLPSIFATADGPRILEAPSFTNPGRCRWSGTNDHQKHRNVDQIGCPWRQLHSSKNCALPQVAAWDRQVNLQPILKDDQNEKGCQLQEMRSINLGNPLHHAIKLLVPVETMTQKAWNRWMMVSSAGKLRQMIIWYNDALSLKLIRQLAWWFYAI